MLCYSSLVFLMHSIRERAETLRMLQPSFYDRKRQILSATEENIQTLLDNWRGKWEMLEGGVAAIYAVRFD